MLNHNYAVQCQHAMHAPIGLFSWDWLIHLYYIYIYMSLSCHIAHNWHWYCDISPWYRAHWYHFSIVTYSSLLPLVSRYMPLHKGTTQFETDRLSRTNQASAEKRLPPSPTRFSDCGYTQASNVSSHILSTNWTHRSLTSSQQMMRRCHRWTSKKKSPHRYC